MQTITIAGNVGKDAETKQVSGNNVTEWSVGVSAGRDKETTWYRCSLWGVRGEKIAGYIRKGDKITVAGSLTAGVYDGKPDMKINVSEVTLQGGKREGGAGGGFGGGADDSDVPFATNDPMAREPGVSRRVL
jgi:single-strand DNA-binding protein